jgi:lipopolysaccharide/colanic/teichoic acid biosynthesis glycosyltransferase
VLLAAMAAVRLTSRGPAIYTQTRLGRFGRVFTIYKLRTMCQDAESLTGPRWSLPGDPRITPVGHAERPEIAAELRRAIPGYDRRLAVMPGLTGFAQIHLPPDETVGSVRRKLVYDLFYVRRFGLKFDLYILACTAFKVVGLRRLYCRRKPVVSRRLATC